MSHDARPLRSLHAKADPCEWSVHRDRGTWSICTAHGGVVVDGLSREVAELVAESKNALGPLLDEIETWHWIAERDHGAPIETVEKLRARIAEHEPHVTQQELRISDLTRRLAAVEHERDRLAADLAHLTAQAGDDSCADMATRCRKAEHERDTARDAARQHAAAYDRVVNQKHAIEHERDELRAALTAEDVEALRLVRFELEGNRWIMGDNDQALAVLDRVIAAHGGGGK